MNKYNKINLTSIKPAVLVALSIISITVLPFLIGVFGSNMYFYIYQTYIVMFFHCFIGIIYSTFKARVDAKVLYATTFFITIITLSVLWGCISFAFIMGDYVFGPIGLITLVPALIGVAIYEIFSLIVLGLKTAIKQNSVDKITKASSVKSIIVVCIFALLGNITPWLLDEWSGIFPFIIMIIVINILGVALVNTVVNSRKKWIPIVVFVCINAVLIPLNIWLLNTNGIIVLI